MEQKKEKKVYAAFDRQTRRSWKRAARKAVCSHYSMAILLCLVAAFLGAEFSGSLSMLHLTEEKWNTVSAFLASFGRAGAEANSRGVFAMAVNKLSSGSLQSIIADTVALSLIHIYLLIPPIPVVSDVIPPEVYPRVNALLAQNTLQPRRAFLQHILPCTLTDAEDDLSLIHI